MNYTYLLIDLGTILIPFIFSFHPKLRFDKVWFEFLIALFIVGTFFIVWDIYFTKIGVWGFNKDYLTGVYLFNLPIEEVLFFLCIPYACVFTYHCFKKLLPANLIRKQERYIVILLFVLLIIFGLLALPKYYTSTTFLLLGATFFYFFIKPPTWLNIFLLSYGVCIFPFFVVNGILTGSWIESPIVWYNDMENLGIRLGTIPVEDIFYGMLLILLNVGIMEFLLERKKQKLQ